MADFSLNAGSTQEKWSLNYLKSYTRTSGFMPYMGTGASSVIRVNRDLTKAAGNIVNIPYFSHLSGAGVAEGVLLRGAEEALGNYDVEVRVSTVRNGVLIPESQQYKTDLGLANIAGDTLRAWSAERLKLDTITALGQIGISGGANPDTVVSYGSATAGNLNAWNAANADRIVFGTGAAASGTHSSDLAGIANTEVLNAAMVDKAVDLFESTSTFRLTPTSTDATAGREYKVLFVGTKGFNQLRADADIKNANAQAWTRDEMQNPIFQGGDLLWNGVVIRKLPELGVIGNVGTTSAQVAAAYMCGSNAIACAYAAMPEARKEVTDYGERAGVAIREVRGVQKMTAQGKDLGMVTVFYATGQ